jgi:protein-disulfide isomerase
MVKTKTNQRAVQRETKSSKRSVSSKAASASERKEPPSAYIIASSVLVSGMLVAATVVFFGIQILNGLNDIRYPYDSANPLSINSLVYYGNQVGLDPEWLKSCINSDTYSEAIQNDTTDAQNAQISGTPSFYIGEFVDDTTMRGFIIPGAYPYTIFEKAINGVKANGVDQTFQDMRSDIRDGQYQDYYDYYYKQYTAAGSGFTTDQAVAKATADANAYADTLWQIRELSLGSLEGQKKGNPKVVIVEFTDFECPVCRSFATSTYTQIADNFIDDGVVAYYLRNLPLTQIHDNAMAAAKAGLCANEKGKFWDFQDWMFGITK